MARAPDCSSVQRDIDRGVAGRIVAQRRHQLQNRGAGERARRGGAHARAPLASRAGLRREGGRSKSRSLLNLAKARMSEARLTSLTIESPPPARTIAVRAREGKSEARARACSGSAASSPT